MTTHPFRDGAPFLLLIDTYNIWALITFFFQIVLLSLSPSCFTFCGHHLSCRIAIVFLLLSSVLHFSVSHSSIFFISNQHVPPCRFQVLTQRECYSLLLCHKGTPIHLPPPPDYWYTSFFLAGPAPLHENTFFHHFRVVHWAVQIRFSFQHLVLLNLPPIQRESTREGRAEIFSRKKMQGTNRSG